MEALSCDRACDLRTCDCPATPFPERDLRRQPFTELEYVTAERFGLRMNDGATREELRPRHWRES